MGRVAEPSPAPFPGWRNGWLRATHPSATQLEAPSFYTSHVCNMCSLFGARNCNGSGEPVEFVRLSVLAGPKTCVETLKTKTAPSEDSVAVVGVGYMDGSSIDHEKCAPRRGTAKETTMFFCVCEPMDTAQPLGDDTRGGHWVKWA